MSYRFTRFWAGFLTVLGTVLIVVGVGFGIALLLLDIRLPRTALGGQERVVGALISILAGFVLGGPLVVTGQLLQLFLDQRRLLSKINARMRRWEEHLMERRLSTDIGTRRRPIP